jgi:hypothetical protein
MKRERERDLGTRKVYKGADISFPKNENFCLFDTKIGEKSTKFGYSWGVFDGIDPGSPAPNQGIPAEIPQKQAANAKRATGGRADGGTDSHA